MPEDKPELEKTEPKGVELNEWFRPQLETVVEQNETLIKSASVDVEKAGKVKVSLSWDQKALQRLTDLGFGLPLLFVLPTEEREVSDKIIAMQEMTETRAMSVTVHSANEEAEMSILPYEVELRLPSGKIITRDLIGKSAQTKKLTPWKDRESGKSFFGVFIPDVSNLTDELQIRIVSAKTN